MYGLGQNDSRQTRLWHRVTPPRYQQTIHDPGPELAQPTVTIGEAPAGIAGGELGGWLLPLVAIGALYFFTRK